MTWSLVLDQSRYVQKALEKLFESRLDKKKCCRVFSPGSAQIDLSSGFILRVETYKFSYRKARYYLGHERKFADQTARMHKLTRMCFR